MATLNPPPHTHTLYNLLLPPKPLLKDLRAMERRKSKTERAREKGREREISCCYIVQCVEGREKMCRIEGKGDTWVSKVGGGERETIKSAAEGSRVPSLQ